MSDTSSTKMRSLKAILIKGNNKLCAVFTGDLYGLGNDFESEPDWTSIIIVTNPEMCGVSTEHRFGNY